VGPPEAAPPAAFVSSRTSKRERLAHAKPSVPALADRAREESWSYERFAEALLSTEVSSRESHGGESRIKAARFPIRKTLEEFDFTYQRSVKRQVVEHLGQRPVLRAPGGAIPPGDSPRHLRVTPGTAPFRARQQRSAGPLDPAWDDPLAWKPAVRRSSRGRTVKQWLDPSPARRRQHWVLVASSGPTLIRAISSRGTASTTSQRVERTTECSVVVMYPPVT
jgi:IstB-like ATP binding protein